MSAVVADLSAVVLVLADTLLPLVTITSLDRWDEAMVVVSIEGADYFVGAHLAEVVRRETFNLYSSLRRRNIGMRQADTGMVKLLVGKGLIFVGTTSVTLVNKSDVVEFVDDTVAENKRRKGRCRRAVKREREQSCGLEELEEPEVRECYPPNCNGQPNKGGRHLNLLIRALEEIEQDPVVP